MSSSPYRPIACSLHDRLELAALRGRPVHVQHGSDEGLEGVTVRIRTIRSDAGEEWLVTEPPSQIRLDRIVALDGVPFQGTC